MIIRSDQLAQIDEAMQKRYREEIRKLLREQSPGLAALYDDRTLVNRIAAGVQKARAYGVQSGEGILAYVGLSLAAGPAFHSDPKVRAFLERQSDDPDLKVRWLFARVVEKIHRTVTTRVSLKTVLE